MSCGHMNSKVVDKRKMGRYNYRRRECLDCTVRWTTYEVPISRMQLDRLLRPVGNGNVGPTVAQAKDEIIEGLVGMLCRG